MKRFAQNVDRTGLACDPLVGGAGYTQNLQPDYTVPGENVDKLFNVFNGLGIM